MRYYLTICINVIKNAVLQDQLDQLESQDSMDLMDSTDVMEPEDQWDQPVLMDVMVLMG